MTYPRNPLSLFITKFHQTNYQNVLTNIPNISPVSTHMLSAKHQVNNYDTLSTCNNSSGINVWRPLTHARKKSLLNGAIQANRTSFEASKTLKLQNHKTSLFY